MNHANATRAANRPEDHHCAAPTPVAESGTDHDAHSLGHPITAAPPPEDLMVALAYLYAEMSHDFFRLVRRMTGGCHD